MKTAQVGILIAVALLVQTTVIKIGAGGGTPVDFVLIVVVLTALQRGPVVGLWAGTFGGLFQDALSGGIIGVSGLTKTIIGVGSGVVGSRFILGTVWHRLAFVIGASLVQAFSYLGIYSLIGLKSPMVSFNAVGVEAGLNGVVAIVVPWLFRVMPAMFHRFRQGRNPLNRRRWTTS
jgi:rod shape-determining protein MreD